MKLLRSLVVVIVAALALAPPSGIRPPTTPDGVAMIPVAILVAPAPQQGEITRQASIPAVPPFTVTFPSLLRLSLPHAAAVRPPSPLRRSGRRLAPARAPPLAKS